MVVREDVLEKIDSHKVEPKQRTVSRSALYQNRLVDQTRLEDSGTTVVEVRNLTVILFSCVYNGLLMYINFLIIFITPFYASNEVLHRQNIGGYLRDTYTDTWRLTL